MNGNMLYGSLGAWISSPQAFPLLYLLDVAQNVFTGDTHKLYIVWAIHAR